MEAKPHAVCVPYPAQGHIAPMLKLAKIIHSRGFHVTFVNSEYNHRRLLRSGAGPSVDGLSDFRFDAIPDGLPVTDADVTQDIPSLSHSTMTTCFVPFRDLLARLNDPSSGVPPVTCVVSDLLMSFALDAAEQLGVPTVLLWPNSACAFLGALHFDDLRRRGLTPLQDIALLGNREFMEKKVEGIHGLEGIRFKDYPTFIRTADPDDVMLNFCISEIAKASRAAAVVVNTFDGLDGPRLDALAAVLPPLYTFGPLTLLSREIPRRSAAVALSLWKEDVGTLEWLRGKPEGSVVYVNFGSIAVVSKEQLEELAWGLANSGRSFLWVIRPDLVMGRPAELPEGFLEETAERGRLASWCPQEEVLKHPAVGGFLTHCGWNSVEESISAGVPMACWPFFADQQTNCRYLCGEWGIGAEIEGELKREEVADVIGELMSGGRGKKMREKALMWKNKAMAASLEGGSSFCNVDSLVKDVLLGSHRSNHHG